MQISILYIQKLNLIQQSKWMFVTYTEHRNRSWICKLHIHLTNNKKQNGISSFMAAWKDNYVINDNKEKSHSSYSLVFIERLNFNCGLQLWLKVGQSFQPLCQQTWKSSGNGMRGNTSREIRARKVVVKNTSPKINLKVIMK